MEYPTDECEPYARPKIKQAREELRVHLAEQEFGEWRGCAEQDGRGQRQWNTRPEVGAVGILHSRKLSHFVRHRKNDGLLVQVQNEATDFDLAANGDIHRNNVELCSTVEDIREGSHFPND
jgi:hypothetical protein